MSYRYPRIKIAFEVIQPFAVRKIVAEGSYNLDDGRERRTFLERATEAHLQGQEVRFWCPDAVLAKADGMPFVPERVNDELQGARTAADMVWRHLRGMRRDLASLRTQAKANKNWALADQLTAIISTSVEVSKQMTQALDDAAKKEGSVP